jgi:hypothetical protein
MRKIFILLFISTLFIFAIEQNQIQTERNSLRMDIDDSQSFSPTFNYIFNWQKENFYSGLSYDKTQFFFDETSSTYDHKKTTQTNENLNLTLIGYEKDFGSNSIGLSAIFNYLKIDKNEFGFRITDTSELFFDNEVKLNIYRLNLTLKYFRQLNSNLKFYLNASFHPFTKLNLEQKTLINLVQSDYEKLNSSNNLDLSYDLEARILYLISQEWTLELSGKYSFLPLKYSSLTLDSNLNFISDEVQTDEKNYLYFAKIITPLEILENSFFSFGLGKKIFEIEEEIEKVQLYFIGLDSKF